MALYGIYGSHTTDACPLFNGGNRKLLLEAAASLHATADTLGVKVVAAYHSGLEHTFVWIVEADGAHAVERLVFDSRMAEWNAAKIVPLRTLQDVVDSCQGLEDAG